MKVGHTYRITTDDGSVYEGTVGEVTFHEAIRLHDVAKTAVDGQVTSIDGPVSFRVSNIKTLERMPDTPENDPENDPESQPDGSNDDQGDPDGQQEAQGGTEPLEPEESDPDDSGQAESGGGPNPGDASSVEHPENTPESPVEPPEPLAKPSDSQHGKKLLQNRSQRRRR